MPTPLTREEFVDARLEYARAYEDFGKAVAANRTYRLCEAEYQRLSAAADTLDAHDAALRARLAEAEAANRTLIAGLRHRSCENWPGELRCNEMTDGDAGLCLPCFARALLAPERPA